MNLSLYALTGALNSAFILLSVLGVGAQLRRILQRKRDPATAAEPTAVLSLNQFSVSLLAYFGFFVYGYSLQPFNHYIVWPRLLACLVVLLILREIWRDRRSRAAAIVYGSAIVLVLAGLAGLLFGSRFVDHGRQVSAILLVVVTVLLAQGYAHQIALIWRAGRTGAVSLRMSQFILLMDCSSIAFGLAMGLAEGWPLLLLASVSALTKLAILWLFRWERSSELARQRRAAVLVPA